MTKVSELFNCLSQKTMEDVLHPMFQLFHNGREISGAVFEQYFLRFYDRGYVDQDLVTFRKEWVDSQDRFPTISQMLGFMQRIRRDRVEEEEFKAVVDCKPCKNTGWITLACPSEYGHLGYSIKSGRCKCRNGQKRYEEGYVRVDVLKEEGMISIGEYNKLCGVKPGKATADEVRRIVFKFKQEQEKTT